MKLKFGKYKGKTVAWVKKNDQQYLEWLLGVTDFEPLKKEIEYQLGGDGKAKQSEYKKSYKTSKQLDKDFSRAFGDKY